MSRHWTRMLKSLNFTMAGITDPHYLLRFYEPSSAEQTSMPASA